MLKTIINQRIPQFSSLRDSTLFLLLLAASAFVRLPFFFRDYIDRDESTFILLGQSWVDGHLPYTELWDLKPPIVYLFFAGIIYFFGKSFIAIRLAGAIIVAITAFFTYKITDEIGDRKTGFVGAVGCVYLISMFGSLQGVMSEHISMLFFMPSLYLLIKYKSYSALFIGGLLMGLAIMTKLNLAYPGLFLGLYLLYTGLRKKNTTKGVASSFVFGLGIIVIILLTLLPYYIQDSSLLWWKSVIQAPLEYSNSQRYSFIKLLPLPIILGCFFFFSWKRRLIDFKRPRVQLLFIAIISVGFSFIQGGRVNGHYLIQLYPILIVLVGLSIHNLLAAKRIKLSKYLFFILILLLPVEAYKEYYLIMRNKMDRGTFFNGEGITVPNYIKENNLESENILFMEYHIGYWLLDKNPPTKASTHPSSICREEIYPFFDNPRSNPIEELRFIMESIEPPLVITRAGKPIFDKSELSENEYMNAYLKNYYSLIQQVDNAKIYQRLK